jgi:hypothetical protein
LGPVGRHKASRLTADRFTPRHLSARGNPPAGSSFVVTATQRLSSSTGDVIANRVAPPGRFAPRRRIESHILSVTPTSPSIVD